MNNFKTRKTHRMLCIGIAALLSFSALTGCGINKNIAANNEAPVESSAAQASDDASETSATSDTSEPSAPADASDTEAWRQFLRDYEAWADKYIAFLKKINDNPKDFSYWEDYGKLMEEAQKWGENAAKYEDELQSDDFPPEFLSEYLSTLSRITKKMAELD